MKKQTAKRSLLLSALALIMCVAMLVGTTFAWFTDSVTSGKNTIKAGNLDVQLFYLSDAENDVWTEVDENTDVFGYDKWEPGFTKVVYFKVVNNGSLALKYQLAADVYNEKEGVNKDGDTFKLSDFLYAATVAEGATREEILAMDGNNFIGNIAIGGEGTLVPDVNEEAIVGLAIWMPTFVGNVANHNGTDVPEIDFGIKLVATQATSEIDSFGNGYDVNATYPVIQNAVAEGGDSITAGIVKVELPIGATEDNYALKVDNVATSTNEDGDTALSFDIDLLKNGTKIQPEAGVSYPVSIFVGTGLNVAAVKHNGNDIAAFSYDGATGVVSFETDSFSPFEIVYYSGKVTSDTAAELIVKGGEFSLSEDVTLEEQIVIPEDKELVIDLNGQTITAGEDGYTIVNENGGKVIIKDSVGNGEIKGVVYNANGGEMIIENGIFTAVNNYAILNDAATLTINGGVINGTAKTYPLYSYNDGQNLTINNVTINGIFGALNCYGTGNVVINDGTFNMVGVAGKSCHIAYFSTTANVTINGGSFNHISDISFSAAGGGGVCLMGSANVTINGGSFAGDYADIYSWGSTIPTINAGTFEHSPEARFVAANHNIVKNADGTFSVVGTKVATETELADALSKGYDVFLTADITLDKPITNVKAGVTIDGNGKTITNSDAFTYPVSLFDLTTNDITFKNVVFDGVKKVAAVRGVNADNLVFDGCTFKNNNHTVSQGLIRTARGALTVKNCVFTDNKFDIGVSFNFDADNDTKLLVENCLFQNNTAKSIGIIYYTAGAGCEILGNSFVNNTTDTTANGATVYLGFKSNCVVNNNLFSGNKFITTGTSKRISGGVQFGGSNSSLSGNAFINNTTTNASGALGGSFCASVYYNDIDLSGNFWGGSAPVKDVDYSVEYTNYSVVCNSFATSYTVDADGAGVTVK